MDGITPAPREEGSNDESAVEIRGVPVAALPSTSAPEDLVDATAVPQRLHDGDDELDDEDVDGYVPV